MGTRGAFGFRKDGVDKITYNHFDSYPTGLGTDMLSFAAKVPVKEMNEIYDRIEMVSLDTTPTPAQIKECRKFSDTGVSNQTLEDWYCLLRGAQRNPFAYRNDKVKVHKGYHKKTYKPIYRTVNGGLKYMIEYSGFLGESLFCEWAYIINLDEEVLEIYKGFNKDPNARGRYAHLEPSNDPCDFKYRGVAEICTIPLSEIKKQNLTDEDVECVCGYLEEVLRGEEEEDLDTDE